jgi:hypothetical protein
VLNLLGAVVFTENYGNLPIGKQSFNFDLGLVVDGIYQMRLLTDQGQVTRRLEVIR